MLNFFKLFKRKPRIIPFNTLCNDEKELLEKYRKLTPENKCKVLSFKPSPKPAINPLGRFKLFFIWDYLP